MQQEELATWFENTYLKRECWSSWYIGASRVAGIMANNNALESAQRVQKRVETKKSHNATNERVFCNTIPSILQNAKPHDNVGIVAEGPIPGKWVTDASVIWKRTTNAKECVLPCQEGFLVCGLVAPNKKIGITQSKADCYLNVIRDNEATVNFSSISKLRASIHDPAFNFKDEMICPFGMHLVRYDSSVSSFIPLKPNYTVDETNTHRRCMTCDCIRFHESTWICEHVLLARYSLFVANNSKGFNLIVAGSDLKGRGKAGRPKKSIHCLQNDNNRDEKNILKAIHREPYRLIGEQVVYKSIVLDKLFHLDGKVSGVNINNQRNADVEYLIKFSDGSEDVWPLAKVWKNRLVQI